MHGYRRFDFTEAAFPVVVVRSAVYGPHHIKNVVVNLNGCGLCPMSIFVSGASLFTDRAVMRPTTQRVTLLGHPDNHISPPRLLLSFVINFETAFI